MLFTKLLMALKKVIKYFTDGTIAFTKETNADNNGILQYTDGKPLSVDSDGILY